MGACNYGIIFSIILGVVSARHTITAVVKEADTLFLPCNGEKGNRCMWTRIIPGTSGEIIAESNTASTSSRYHLTDSPELGDCSLNITEITTDDLTIFICHIIPHPSVIKYRIFVGVEPKYPHIEYNNKKFNDGDLVKIETPAEIKCVVKGGKPGAVVIWENEENDAVNVTRVVNGELTDVINTLKIESFPREIKPGKRIKCVARHPLYDENRKRTITVTVAEKKK